MSSEPDNLKVALTDIVAHEFQTMLERLWSEFDYCSDHCVAVAFEADREGEVLRYRASGCLCSGENKCGVCFDKIAKDKTKQVFNDLYSEEDTK
jgi:hypothetical protein